MGSLKSMVVGWEWEVAGGREICDRYYLKRPARGMRSNEKMMREGGDTFYLEKRRDEGGEANVKAETI